MRIFAFSVALLLSGFPAQAEGNDLHFPPSDWAPELIEVLRAGPGYLPRDTNVSLPAPPKPGSATAAAEISILKLRQTYDRTPENIAMITSEGDPAKTVLQVFAEHGHLPDPKKSPGLEKFLTEISTEVRWFVLREKWTFQRARPSQLDPSLDPVLPVPGHASYPSGHATESRALALVLARLDPACAASYLSLADAIGDRREIAGLHFPSDSRAGEFLADQIVSDLLEGPLASEAFEQELKAVTWRAAEGACPYGP